MKFGLIALNRARNMKRTFGTFFEIRTSHNHYICRKADSLSIS